MPKPGVEELVATLHFLSGNDWRVELVVALLCIWGLYRGWNELTRDRGVLFCLLVVTVAITMVAIKSSFSTSVFFRKYFLILTPFFLFIKAVMLAKAVQHLKQSWLLGLAFLLSLGALAAVDYQSNRMYHHSKNGDWKIQ